jgi:arabinogalactan endo-1,4-beta-galactosidase
MNYRVSKPSWSHLAAAGGASLLVWHCTSEAPPPGSVTAPGLPGSDAVVAPNEPAPAGEEPSEPPAVASTPGTEGNPTPESVAPPAAPPPAVAPPAAEVPPAMMPPAEAPPPFTGSFVLGADISSVQESVAWGSVFVDTDGSEKSMVALLKSHGFNYVRLRTFVAPSAAYGYASGNGCEAKMAAYNDRDHTIEFAREVKAAGMGLLLDFHYSDTWADPGKQLIPEAWRGATSVAELAQRVEEYTLDVLGAMVAAGVRPDMVQVGNEITPGMLIHVPTAETDCYGNNSVVNPQVNGSAQNWDNLATLLRAGIGAVRQVDSSLLVMLHIENLESTAGVADWVLNATERGVSFDVLGLSAYEEFQGPVSAWRGNLQALAVQFPELSFAIAEYNPQRRLLNDLMRELPEGRGLGTFLWEPTQSGAWGPALFDWQGSRATARAEDFAEYDRLRVDFGL